MQVPLPLFFIRDEMYTEGRDFHAHRKNQEGQRGLYQ